MIKWELKKIFSNKYFFIVLIALCLIDFYKIYTIKESQNFKDIGEERIYSQVKGEITEDKAKFLIDNVNRYSEIVQSDDFSKKYNKKYYTGYLFGDYNAFDELYNKYKYCWEYSAKAKKIIKKCEKNKQYSTKFIQDDNNLVIKQYKNRDIQAFYNMDELSIFLEYNFSTILMIIILLIGVINLVLYERKNKMINVISSSKKGARSIINEKIKAIIILSIFVVLIFSFIDYISFSALFELEGFTQPLYAMEEYANTVVNLTTFETYGLSIFARILTCIFYALIAYVSVILIGDISKTIIVEILMLVVGIIICIYSKCIFNPIGMFMLPTVLKEWNIVDVLGFALPYYKVAILANVAAIILLICLANLLKNRFISSGRT